MLNMPRRRSEGIRGRHERRPAERASASSGCSRRSRASASPPCWQRVDELMRLVVELYGAGLRRIVEIVGDDADATGAARAGWPRTSWWRVCCSCTDSTRRTFATRVRTALARVRPYLGSHGGDVEVVELDERRGSRAPAHDGQLRRLPVVRDDGEARRREARSTSWPRRSVGSRSRESPSTRLPIRRTQWIRLERDAMPGAPALASREVDRGAHPALPPRRDAVRVPRPAAPPAALRWPMARSTDRSSACPACGQRLRRASRWPCCRAPRGSSGAGAAPAGRVRHPDRARGGARVTSGGGAPRTERRPGPALGVLGRFRGQAPKPAPGERCEMCAADDRRRALACRERREPQPAVHLPRLLPALHPHRRGAGQVSRRARSLPPSAGVRPRCGALGRAPDSGPHGVLLLQLERSRASSPSTRARPGRPSRCCRSTRGRRCSRRIPFSRPSSPTWRRCWSTAGAAPTRSTASWCRSTPATSSPGSSGAAGRGSTAARRRWRDIDAFFARLCARSACRQPRRRDESRSPSRCSTRRPCRTRRLPRSSFRLHLEAPSGETIHSIALHCQIRIEPQRRRYSGGRGSAAARALRRDPALGRHAEAVPVDARVDDGARVRGQASTSSCRCRAPTTSTWRRPSTSMPSGDGEIPLLLLFSGTVFAKGDGGAAA